MEDSSSRLSRLTGILPVSDDSMKKAELELGFFWRWGAFLSHENLSKLLHLDGDFFFGFDFDTFDAFEFFFHASCVLWIKRGEFFRHLGVCH